MALLTADPPPRPPGRDPTVIRAPCPCRGPARLRSCPPSLPRVAQAEELSEVGPEGQVGQGFAVGVGADASGLDVRIDLALQCFEVPYEVGAQGCAEGWVGVGEDRRYGPPAELFVDEVERLLEQPPQLVPEGRLPRWEGLLDEQPEGCGQERPAVAVAPVDGGASHPGPDRHRVDVDTAGPLLAQQLERRAGDPVIGPRVTGSSSRRGHVTPFGNKDASNNATHTVAIIMTYDLTRKEPS